MGKLDISKQMIYLKTTFTNRNIHKTKGSILEIRLVVAIGVVLYCTM